MHSTAFTPAILGQPDLMAVDSIPSAILDPGGQARSRLGQPDVEALDSIPSAWRPWTRSPELRSIPARPARRERRGGPGLDPGGVVAVCALRRGPARSPRPGGLVGVKVYGGGHW
ncbi:MAG: hypothetical protein OXG50_16240 [bacterium]|nr:hypothetical protein [bacterium]